MRIFDEPKIDCHAHVLDPARFPYGRDNAYKPAGQELGTAAQYRAMMDIYGIRHTLLVQPNSGYDHDNSCMLDAIKNGGGRFKGIAMIALDADVATIKKFKSQGIIGAVVNPTLRGNDYYRNCRPLIEKLAELDMFLNIQVEHDQLEMYVPWIEEIPVKVLLDHCARPTPTAGFKQAGFAAALRLAKTKRVSVKISGYPKFAGTSYPFEDCWPYVRALADAFGLEHCMWASDWPYLRAPERQDVGPLIALAETLFPNPADRQALFWDTPQRLFGFGERT